MSNPLTRRVGLTFSPLFLKTLAKHYFAKVVSDGFKSLILHAPPKTQTAIRCSFTIVRGICFLSRLDLIELCLSSKDFLVWKQSTVQISSLVLPEFLASTSQSKAHSWRIVIFRESPHPTSIVGPWCLPHLTTSCDKAMVYLINVFRGKDVMKTLQVIGGTKWWQSGGKFMVLGGTCPFLSIRPAVECIHLTDWTLSGSVQRRIGQMQRDTQRSTRVLIPCPRSTAERPEPCNLILNDSFHWVAKQTICQRVQMAKNYWECWVPTGAG